MGHWTSGKATTVGRLPPVAAAGRGRSRWLAVVIGAVSIGIVGSALASPPLNTERVAHQAPVPAPIAQRERLPQLPEEEWPNGAPETATADERQDETVAFVVRLGDGRTIAGQFTTEDRRRGSDLIRDWLFATTIGRPLITDTSKINQEIQEAAGLVESRRLAAELLGHPAKSRRALFHAGFAESARWWALVQSISRCGRAHCPVLDHPRLLTAGLTKRRSGSYPARAPTGALWMGPPGPLHTIIANTRIYGLTGIRDLRGPGGVPLAHADHVTRAIGAHYQARAQRMALGHPPIDPAALPPHLR